MKELPEWIIKPKKERKIDEELQKLRGRVSSLEKAKAEIKEAVASSYHFSRKRMLKDLKDLNDMGFSNKLICEILEFSPEVLKRFLKGKKPHEVNYLKLNYGLAEIKKQHENKEIK